MRFRGIPHVSLGISGILDAIMAAQTSFHFPMPTL